MKALLAAAAAAIALAGPASALDLTDMNQSERSALREEIRAYILDNPEVIMEAVAILEQRQNAQKAQSDAQMIATNAEALFEDDASWVGGNPEGDLTLVEFMDYRCGYCRKAAPEVSELIESDGNIRIIVKEFPILGDQSVIASRFAIAVLQLEGDAAYEKAHDTLIKFKGEIGRDALTRIAGDLGLEAAPILERMDSDAVTEVISRNHQLASRLQITGTPTFVMGEQMLRGYVPLDKMRQIAAQIRKDQ
ncbi:MAG: DsbA family protein [Sediminimonas sp.]|uniref:DsbA family protein n=1 Tax=Sediminimonas sp. TaxID=2823379 RepID=UPI0028708E57|nr:DsbA family protein [Sediminimonas sp.]MDR9483956.1 DsbA family protein [Sediminimonas sp.]